MRQKSKKEIGISLLLLIVVTLFCVVIGKYAATNHLTKIVSTTKSFFSDTNQAEEPWNLILVNSNHAVPEDYQVDLTELSNGKMIDSRIYPALQEMFDDMRSQGIYPVVGEGYRTEEEQQAMMTEKINAYLAEGYSEKKAEKLAKDWVAVPGYSEHQLGLAIDINADKSVSANDEVYQWLAENAYRYGFILRYPEGKEDITGTSYEPWHYRYVGKEAALEIQSQQICLEEYLE